MKFDPYGNLPGGYSTNDGTIDFYSRVKTLLHKDMVILDLGAGRAAWYEDDSVAHRRETRFLKGHVKKVIAVDVDSAVLENRSADECLVMIDDTIPVPDDSIDLIVSDYVLEHVSDPKAFFNEVDRVLKKGGWFCARTPHKFNYVSLVSRLLVHNSRHVHVLKWVQPGRKEVDVFPTRYRLNSLKQIRHTFRAYSDKSFIFRADPSYYFGKKTFLYFFSFLHRVLPAFMCGNIFVFLKKSPD